MCELIHNGIFLDCAMPLILHSPVRPTVVEVLQSLVGFAPVWMGRR